MIARSDSSLGPEPRKTLDAASYDPLAAGFDAWSERISGPLAERLLDLTDLGPNARVLDVGCGSGVLTRRLARRVGPGGRVLGADLSAGMLAQAKTQAAGQLPAQHYLRADAEALALQTGTFDAALSLFALTHFPAPLAALQEMRRALRPGGRLTVAIGGPPTLASAAGVGRAFAHLRRLLLSPSELHAPQALDALVAGVPAQTEAHPKPAASIAASGLPELVRRAGFLVLRCDWAGGELSIETPEEFWDLQRTLSSLARQRLAGAPDETVAAIREQLVSASQSVLERGGRLLYRYGARIVSARPDERA